MAQPTVSLRARTDADIEVLFRIASDLSTWEERGPSSPAPLSEDAYRTRLSESEASGSDPRFVIDADGVPAGWIGLFDFDHLARHAEVGIALVSEVRGRGIGTAAIQQMVEFAFVRCNLRRVHLEVIESNQGAIRAYEKAGFTVEGRQREHAWVRGRYEDIIRMGLLQSEWQFSRG